MGEFPSVDDLVSGVAVVIPFKIKKRERANQHTKIEKRREPTYRKKERTRTECQINHYPKMQTKRTFFAFSCISIAFRTKIYVS